MPTFNNVSAQITEEVWSHETSYFVYNFSDTDTVVEQMHHK